MDLKDNIDFVGHFGIKIYKKDGTIEEYEDKNLIMDRARQNMAQLVGGVTTGGAALEGRAIDSFRIGTQGHNGTILDYIKVGSNGFDSTRTNMFSEASAAEHYTINFNAAGSSSLTVTSTSALNSVLGDVGESCTVNRTVSDRTVTYVITIPDSSANASDTTTSVIAYTEAALYAGDDIFSMKTFPARVKEDTVKFVITWSIIF